MPSAETHTSTSSDEPHESDDIVLVLGHVTQQNGELTEDAVEAAVVDSTAVAEDGGVRSVEVDDDHRIVWVAPLPDDLRADGARR
jgi:hypothetical protein